MDWNEIPDRFASILFPHRCLFCDEVVAYDDFWCGKCSGEGVPPYTRLGIVSCDLPHSFVGAVAAFEYGDGARSLVWRLKDKADRRALSFFARAMRAAMWEYWSDVGFDLIVPVPSSASALKERGFNHAEALARHLSGYMGVPMWEDALVRYDGTRVQRDLTAAERRINAARSYGVGRTHGVAGKTVLLADDVFTTGATAAACSDKLLDAGAARVYVLAATGSLLKDENATKGVTPVSAH